MEPEEQDSFIAIRWPAGKRAHLKMFIYSSGRFVLSRLIYTLSAWIRKKRRISSHPISIPITKRSWTTKHRSASSASSIVRWLIDSLAMDWLRSPTIKSPSSLTYWSNVQSINTSSKKPVTIKNQVEVTLSFQKNVDFHSLLMRSFLCLFPFVL